VQLALFGRRGFNGHGHSGGGGSGGALRRAYIIGVGTAGNQHSGQGAGQNQSIQQCHGMNAMTQQSFSDLEFNHKKKVTRKERFLGEMEQIIPWKILMKPIRKHYTKAGNGRQPIGPLTERAVAPEPEESIQAKSFLLR
jgi:hypothetical protein